MQGIEMLLYSAGIISSYKGYWLLEVALEIVLADFSLIENLVDRVYCSVGESCGISPVSVERNIHTAIARAWHTAPRRVNAALGRSEVWQPTVAEFIALAVKQLEKQPSQR